MRCLILATLLLAAFATPASARLSGYHCQVYFGDDDHAPSEVVEVLNRVEGSAIRKCSHATFYELISPPSWNRLGVCQVTQWRLIKEAGSLEYMPSDSTPAGFPRLFMMASDGDCPQQDDPRYLPTEDVTAGVFSAAVRFWEEVSSGDNGIGNLLATFRGGEISERFARDLEDFERDFRNGEVQLSAVRLGHANKRIAPYFELELGRSGTFWSLLVDFEDGELVVLGLGVTIVD